MIGRKPLNCVLDFPAPECVHYPLTWNDSRGKAILIAGRESMPGFNPLDHPACLSYPVRLAPSAFAEHIPFAFYLVDALRPRVIVELGTTSGVSYCTFCQAVKELGLSTRLFAVSTWESDSRNGLSATPEVLSELKAHHDSLYGPFSSLIQNSLDEACPAFKNGTIDLLHFNEYRTYAAIKHDFELWLPKMSEQGVMLINNISARTESGE